MLKTIQGTVVKNLSNTIILSSARAKIGRELHEAGKCSCISCIELKEFQNKILEQRRY